MVTTKMVYQDNILINIITIITCKITEFIEIKFFIATICLKNQDFFIRVYFMIDKKTISIIK
jgi:hypothetical protein